MSEVVQKTEPVATRQLELLIGGMTCAACVGRVERRLGKLDGVRATVNLATEKARVFYPPTLSAADIVAAVEAAGYTAEVPRPAGTDAATGEDRAESLRRRLVVSLVLAVPVVVLSMVPPLQFPAWQFVALVLAAPVVTWGAWPFHRTAWTNLRHAAATMDTLVSLGITAAFGWSVYAVLFGAAGRIGLRHEFSMMLERVPAGETIYLEVAAGVTTFILAGRYFEARAKRRAGAALRALLELGAKDVAVLRAAPNAASPLRTWWPGTGSSCGPARRSRRTEWWRMAAPRWI
jgi:Cu+-exporting ATPase